MTLLIKLRLEFRIKNALIHTQGIMSQLSLYNHSRCHQHYRILCPDELSDSYQNIGIRFPDITIALFISTCYATPICRSCTLRGQLIVYAIYGNLLLTAVPYSKPEWLTGPLKIYSVLAFSVQ